MKKFNKKIDSLKSMFGRLFNLFQKSIDWLREGNLCLLFDLLKKSNYILFFNTKSTYFNVSIDFNFILLKYLKKKKFTTNEKSRVNWQQLI